MKAIERKGHQYNDRSLRRTLLPCIDIPIALLASNLPLHFHLFSEKRGDTNFETGNRNAGLSSFLRYDYHKPINLNLQFDLSVGMNVGAIYNLELDEPTPQIQYRPELNLALGYFPTTRTELTTSFQTSYVISEEDVPENMNEDGLRIISQTNFYYYLSPQTRLSGYIELGYFDVQRRGTCGSIHADFGQFPISSGNRNDCQFSNFGLRLTHSFL